MADTGEQLRTKVKYNIGDRDDKDVVVLAAINTAVDRLAALHNWRNLQETHYGTLGADTETMTLPEYTKSVISVWYVRDDTEFHIQISTAFRNDKNTKGNIFYGITEHVYEGETRTIANSLQGSPRVCYVFGNAMYFYPIPTEDTTIYMRVIKKPDEVTAGTEHNLGEGLDHVIVAFATAQVQASLGLHDDAYNWERRAFQLFRETREAEHVTGWTPQTTIDHIPLHR